MQVLIQKNRTRVKLTKREADGVTSTMTLLENIRRAVDSVAAQRAIEQMQTVLNEIKEPVEELAKPF